MYPRYRVPDILAILLLTTLATLAVFDVYLPSRERNRRAQAKVHSMIVLRDTELAHEALLADKRDRLQAREAEMVETAIRQELKWGGHGEVLIPYQNMTRR